MSQAQRTTYAQMIKRIGNWAGVRYLRNKGVGIEDAYELIIGRPMPGHRRALLAGL
jgi:hypothetical protein